MLAITMRYRLRTLLIVLAALPPLLASAWFAAQVDWHDAALLLVAIACAIPYGLGIATLLGRNLHHVQAWGIAVVLAFMWPSLFFMSVLQLADLAKPLSRKSIAIATGLTLAFFAWIGCVALIHGQDHPCSASRFESCCC